MKAECQWEIWTGWRKMEGSKPNFPKSASKNTDRCLGETKLCSPSCVNSSDV